MAILRSASRFDQENWFQMEIDKDVPSCEVNGILDGEPIDFSGGGASNIVEGTFTPSADVVNTLEIPYTGNGYPIACFIHVEGGAINPESALYTGRNRNKWGFFAMYKTFPNLAPTYETSGNANMGSVVGLYRTSDTEGATSYSENGEINTNIFSSSDAVSSSSGSFKFKANNLISYSSPGSTSTSYGFLKDQTYYYYIIYSE